MFDATYFTERLRKDASEMKGVAVIVYLDSGARFLAHRVVAADAGVVEFEVYPTEDTEPLGQARWLERIKQREAGSQFERMAVAYDTISHISICSAAARDAATIGFHVG